MYTLRELKKAANSIVDGKEIKVAVLGNCATQFFSTAVQGYGKTVGLNVNIFDADYNQIDAQLLDINSEVYSFEPEIIIMWLDSNKLYEEFLDSNIYEKKQFAESTITKINHYWNLIQKNTKAKIIQLNFAEINDKALGNFSCKIDSTFTYQLRKMNYLLQEEMSKQSSVFPVDLLSVQMRLGASLFNESKLYYNAKMSIPLNSVGYLAKEVIDVILSTQGKIKKCLVCDLDNTLWGGVIGDDGLGGIHIGELGQGHAFTNLQRWIKQLKDCGIIIAICSKNNEDTAKEPFEKHEEMILKLDDISLFVANWNDKASNIRMIQESLNIGMDSIVFIDDNPFERNLVKELIPEITVPDLPEDPALYLEYLQNCNLFETASFSSEGADRTKQYQAEFERKKLEMSFESIDDYLKSLEMIGEAKPFEPVRYSRIAQLTQRSNQFNLRTVRYTDNDIERIANDDKYITLYYTLRDKFGDHGLVSVVILDKLSDKELFVDTWLMSCRVLKRGMEEFIVNKLIDTAKNNGFEKVYAEYIPTAKNKMVENIYSNMGFKTIRENYYEIEVNDFKEKINYINEENL